MSICMEEDYMQIMRDADEALNRYHAERAAKDAAVLGEVKAMVSTEVFSEIEQELTACESVGEYVIVDEAVGEPQDDGFSLGDVFIVQETGPCGDDHSGTVCMPLPDGRYFQFSFAC